MNKKLAITGMTILLVVSMPAAADSYSPSHSCRKPYKSYKFEDQWAIDRFKREVETYKQCIADFVEEQNDEVEHHREAAEEAIEEWNSYVNYELR